MSSVWPTWPDGSGEHQCQLAGWVTWVNDFQPSCLGDLVKSPWVTGSLVLQVNTIVNWLAWLVKLTSLLVIWSGEQLHLFGLSD